MKEVYRSKVREKFSYPLVLRTNTMYKIWLSENPRVLVQKV